MNDPLRMLIADDDEQMRLMLQTALTAAGFEVTAAADGQEAWNIFQEHLHEKKFDFVVADEEMPFMNGAELLRLVKQARPLCKTIWIPDNITGADPMPDNGFKADLRLEKPLYPSDLIREAHRLFFTAD